MRKQTKSYLGLLLNSFSKQSNLPEMVSLFKMVVAYCTPKHYGAHLTVVFDGYGQGRRFMLMTGGTKCEIFTRMLCEGA